VRLTEKWILIPSEGQDSIKNKNGKKILFKRGLISGEWGEEEEYSFSFFALRISHSASSISNFTHMIARSGLVLGTYAVFQFTIWY
jgi:hypothetical protein